MSGKDWNVDRRWVLGLTLVALVTRLIGLNSQMWTDEVFSLVRYVRRPITELYTHFYSNNQHPLYSLLARATMDVFGEAAWTYRLPAALIGVATVPALYYLGARVASRREAFLAAALLALSYHHVWFSQNGRGYTAILLGAVVCTHLLLRGIEEQQPRMFIWYGVVAGLGAYTHLGMVLVVVGQAAAVAVYLALRVRPLRRWVWPLAAFPMGAAFTLLFHGPMLPDVIDFFVNKPSPAKGLATPTWAAVETVLSLIGGLGGTAVVGGAALLVIAVLGLLGLVSYAKRQPLALGLFLAPVVITALGVMGGRGIVYPRFFFGVVGFGILLFVRGPFELAERIAARRGRPNRLGEIVVGVLLLAFAASVPVNYLVPKQDFEGAMAHIEANLGENDAVASVGKIEIVYQRYYGRDWPKVWSPEEIAAQAVGHDQLWLVFMMADYVRHVNPELMDYVRSSCKDMKRFRGTLRGGAIYTCHIPVTGTSSTAQPGSGS